MGLSNNYMDRKSHSSFNGLFFGETKDSQGRKSMLEVFTFLHSRVLLHYGK